MAGHGHLYDDVFFDYVDATSGRSADALIRRLDIGFRPESVLDVGCGRGAWLAVWKRQGARDVLGLDGDYVDPRTLQIERSEFRVTDLTRPFDLGRKFEWVQCLEVAEHIPETSASELVSSIVRHGDVVLFSAAPPGQGGEHHVNEQPLVYWIRLFAARGFAVYDCVRPAVASSRDIAPWYRYNTLLFANPVGELRLSASARAYRLEPGAEPREFAPLRWRLMRAARRVIPPAVIDFLYRSLSRPRSRASTPRRPPAG